MASVDKIQTGSYIMTISQIRNQTHSLQRKFARELAVYRLSQLAQEIADDWAVAVADKEELPQPHQVVRLVGPPEFSLTPT